MTDSVITIHSLTPDTNRRALDYFDAVNAEITGGKGSYKSKLQILVVVHAYENMLPFIQSLEKFATIAGVVFKNSTSQLRPEYAQTLTERGYPILQISKSDFINSSRTVLDKINSVLDPRKKTIIMDHGGYFAFLGQALFDYFPSNKLIGITEYAANGEERWKTTAMNDRPILSIGRSDIKHSSDIASAESIIDAAVYYAQLNNIPLKNKYTKIGIIGHGRLGQGISDHLSRNRISDISVFDIDDLKLSGLRHLNVVPKEELLRKSDIIFCATGNKAITANDYNLLKNNVVLFTVTSPDDELNLDHMIANKTLTPDGAQNNTYRYKVTTTGNTVFLPFNGESPNIILPNAVGDPVIYQPYGLQLAATGSLFANARSYSKGVHPVEPHLENTVARIWNQHFNLNRNTPPSP